jgi:hypothetical protein
VQAIETPVGATPYQNLDINKDGTVVAKTSASPGSLVSKTPHPEQGPAILPRTSQVSRQSSELKPTGYNTRHRRRRDLPSHEHLMWPLQCAASIIECLWSRPVKQMARCVLHSSFFGAPTLALVAVIGHNVDWPVLLLLWPGER